MVRCFFHYIRFPDPETMKRIIAVHHPDIKKRLAAEALAVFYEIREVPGIKKKPSTAELLYGALQKSEQDLHLFERLAFLNRRENR